MRSRRKLKLRVSCLTPGSTGMAPQHVFSSIFNSKFILVRSRSARGVEMVRRDERKLVVSVPDPWYISEWESERGNIQRVW